MRQSVPQRAPERTPNPPSLEEQAATPAQSGVLSLQQVLHQELPKSIDLRVNDVKRAYLPVAAHKRRRGKLKTSSWWIVGYSEVIVGRGSVAAKTVSNYGFIPHADGRLPLL